jgi:hypothetical protein
MNVRLSVAPLSLSRIAMRGSVAFLPGGLAFDSVVGLGQRKILLDFIKRVVGVYLTHMDSIITSQHRWPLCRLFNKALARTPRYDLMHARIQVWKMLTLHQSMQDVDGHQGKR